MSAFPECGQLRNISTISSVSTNDDMIFSLELFCNNTYDNYQCEDNKCVDNSFQNTYEICTPISYFALTPSSYNDEFIKSMSFDEIDHKVNIIQKSHDSMSICKYPITPRNNVSSMSPIIDKFVSMSM